MKKYETVFILDERKLEDDGKAFAAEFSKLVTEGKGEVIETTPMGRKQFAREIKRRKAGIYWDFIITLPPEKAAEIPEQYRLDERVLRTQVFIYDRPE